MVAPGGAEPLEVTGVTRPVPSPGAVIAPGLEVAEPEGPAPEGRGADGPGLAGRAPAPDGPGRDGPGLADRMLDPDGSGVDEPGLADGGPAPDGAGAVGLGAGGSGSAGPELTGPEAGWLPVGGRSPDSLARCRDDGVVARWLGRPVRGNLAALPPAIAGLTATVIVALLGLVGLPGPLVMTPVVAMLLASAGTSYRHARRADWLVPALLQAGQFVFIGAVGFGRGVPAPVTFTLCAMIGLYYATLIGTTLTGTTLTRPTLASPALASPALISPALTSTAGRSVSAPSRGGAASAGRHWVQAGGLGWDGRMIFIGICAMAGVAMFAYLVLTAYLGVLVGSKILTICHPEGVGR